MVGSKPARSSISALYKVHEKLGEGGMGTVYRATHRLTRTLVALKQVRPAGGELSPGSSSNRSGHLGLQLTLAHEFQTLASLHHPYVIGVLDYGFDEQFGPYYAMEYLADASTILQAGQGQPIKRRLELLSQLLAALTYLHRRAVVHCDIKPENVMVHHGQVKVVDFGVSAAVGVEKASRGGTVAYMPPEVLQGGPATVAADLYATGIIAYQLLTGGDPFDDGISARIQDQLAAETTVPGYVARALYAAHSAAGTADGSDAAPLTAAANLQDKLNAALLPEGLQHLAPALAGIVLKLSNPDIAQRYNDVSIVVGDLRAALGAYLPIESAQTRESFLQAAAFVGREAELSRLSDALGAANGGHGSVWMIAGETGVGKSRLLEELRVLALVKGGLTARGQAVAAGASPYQLWQELLRLLCLHVEVSDAEAGVLQDIIHDIDKLLERPVTSAPTVSPQASQERLFNTVRALLQRIDKTVLFIMEDVQWAGQDSMTMLAHVAKDVQTLPLLLVGNYRDDEIGDGLKLLGSVNTIKLSRLNDAGIARLATSMLGNAGNDPRMLEYLRRETEGNVFFVVEVVRELAEEAGHLDKIDSEHLLDNPVSRGMQQFVERRLNRVPAAHQAALQLAAVGGREVDLRLMRVADPDLDIAQWLSHCAEAAVLETTAGRWSFAHDKLREGLLARLSGAETKALHQRVAQGLEVAYPGVSDKDALLAYHWKAGAEPSKALPYFMSAATSAARLFLVAGARESFTGALEALGQLPDTESNRRCWVDALTGLNSVAYLSDSQTALQRMRKAEQLILSLGPIHTLERADRLRMAHVLFWTSRALSGVSDARASFEALERVIPLARDCGDEELLRIASSTIGGLMSMQGRCAEALEHLHDAPAFFEKTTNWPEWVRAQMFLGMSFGLTGRIAEGRVAGQKAIQRARELDNLAYWSYALGIEGITAAGRHDWVTALQSGQESVTVAQRGNVKIVEQASHAIVALAQSWLGLFEAAQRSLSNSKALQSVGATRADWFALANLELAFHQGHFQEAITKARETIDVARKMDGALSEGWAHRTWAMSLARIEPVPWDEVDAQMRDSTRVFGDAGLRVPLAHTRMIWAELHRVHGAFSQAHEQLAQAAALFAEFGLSEALAEARQRMSELPGHG